MVRICSVAAMLAIAGAANAAVTGVVWRVVDNTVGNPGSDPFDGAAWSSLTRYTFDLILQGDAGQRINGINMGDAAFPNASANALYTNGSVFNSTFGGNSDPAVPVPFAADPYDTRVDLGAGGDSTNISFAGGIDLVANGTTDQVMRATWFTTANLTLDANGEMRILRVTVGYLPSFDPYLQVGGVPQGFLGTQNIPGAEAGVPNSQIQVGLPGGVLTDLVVGNAFLIPTPGAAALMGLAGLAGLRRRR